MESALASTVVQRTHGSKMVVVSAVSGRYLELAIQYFERAERTANPQRKAKFRELAEDYRDKALQILDRAIESTVDADPNEIA